MSESKGADGILYRHFTIMNQEIDHLKGLIDNLDTRVKGLQKALESLESKTSGEDNRLQKELEKWTAEMETLTSALRGDHETLANQTNEINSRLTSVENNLPRIAQLEKDLASRTEDLHHLTARFEKELAPFVGAPPSPEATPTPEVIEEQEAKEKFIADLATTDQQIEELAESVESEEERRKRKRK